MADDKDTFEFGVQLGFVDGHTVARIKFLNEEFCKCQACVDREMLHLTHSLMLIMASQANDPKAFLEDLKASVIQELDHAEINDQKGVLVGTPKAKA